MPEPYDAVIDVAQPEMVLRRDAAQATLDGHKDRAMRLGHHDCARMIGAHLRRCGYQVKLPPSGSYRTPRGAIRAMKAMGYPTLPDAIDAHGLQRIVPAAAIVADIVQLAGDMDLPALGVVLGNGRIVAFHESAIGAAVLQPFAIEAAWRVEMRKSGKA